MTSQACATWHLVRLEPRSRLDANMLLPWSLSTSASLACNYYGVCKEVAGYCRLLLFPALSSAPPADVLSPSLPLSDAVSR